jgi:hypothetical protein
MGDECRMIEPRSCSLVTDEGRRLREVYLLAQQPMETKGPTGLRGIRTTVYDRFDLLFRFFF